MTRAKGTFWVLKRIAFALVVVGIVLTAISCGKQGNIYGDVVWDGTLYYTDYSGLFSPGLTYGVTYQIQPGLYYYSFYVIYGGYTSLLYSGTYTVSANPGGFLSNGSDNYF